MPITPGALAPYFAHWASLPLFSLAAASAMSVGRCLSLPRADACLAADVSCCFLERRWASCCRTPTCTMHNRASCRPGGRCPGPSVQVGPALVASHWSRLHCSAEGSLLMGCCPWVAAHRCWGPAGPQQCPLRPRAAARNPLTKSPAPLLRRQSYVW